MSDFYVMALDRMLSEYESSIAAQKELMDEGNSFASGRWHEMNEIVRQLKWIKRMDEG